MVTSDQPLTDISFQRQRWIHRSMRPPFSPVTYDATALRGPSRGVHYDLLVMIDIFSRYVPGWVVVDSHDGEVVKAWIDQVVAAQGDIQAASLTIHADRGSPGEFRWSSQHLDTSEVVRRGLQASASAGGPGGPREALVARPAIDRAS
jgi:transposase InsO family protein